MKKIISLIVVGFLIISGFGVVGANLKTKNNTLIESADDNNLVFTLCFPRIDELKFLNKNDCQRIEIDSFSNTYFTYYTSTNSILSSILYYSIDFLSIII